MDIGRTSPKFRSLGLAESKEFHGFSVDKKNVFEIDGEAARFLFQYAPKYVDMLPSNTAAYEQHHKILSGNDSVDSAAHLWAFGSTNGQLTPRKNGLQRPRYADDLLNPDVRVDRSNHVDVIEQSAEVRAGSKQI
jgi:hypothetical protein